MTRAALPQAGGSDGAKRLVPEGDSNLPAWTKGSFGGRFLVRCKNLANTLISFPIPREGKEMQTNPAQQLRSASLPRMRSFFLAQEEIRSHFLLLVQKKVAKKTTPGRGIAALRCQVAEEARPQFPQPRHTVNCRAAAREGTLGCWRAVAKQAREWHCGKVERFRVSVRLAVPEKPFGLTLFLRFFDRCGKGTSPSSATGGGLVPFPSLDPP